MKQNIPNSLRVLLAEIVDYAGLFPPSSVSMAQAVKNYADYLRHEHGFMLGKFVVPISRIDEFAQHAQEHFTSSNIWKISALASDNIGETVEKLTRFNEDFNEFAVVDALEIKVGETSQIEVFKTALPDGISSYFEIPSNHKFNESITKLALTKTRAKIRTGGIVPEAFPPIDEIIKFIRVCIAANIPLKATAGLHHPLQTTKPLTYEPNAQNGRMHGFLNVFLSAAFLRQNLNAAFVREIMSETNAANLAFDDGGVSWKSHRLEIKELQTLRAKGVMSFGSCSFVEPVEDLQALGLL